VKSRLDCKVGHISAGPGAAMILLLNKAIYLPIWNPKSPSSVKALAYFSLKIETYCEARLEQE